MKVIEEWRHVPDFGMGAANSSKSKNSAAARGIAYHKRFYKKLRADIARERPDETLYIEPWFRNLVTRKMCSPDAVLVDPLTATGIVIEAKMNWKAGRDAKLLDKYLPVVKQAFSLDCVWPLLVTGNVRGLEHDPLIWNKSLRPLEACLSWAPGEPTPTALAV